MSRREITYPIRACPCCGYSAEVKECTGLYEKSFIITCTKCHLRTIPVFYDTPTITGGKSSELTYYEALKKVTDMWNERFDCA